MAKKVIKEKAIEEALWESANKLRGSVEPSEYKHVVLSLIFLKYAHDRFTERRNELMAEGKEAFADNPVFYPHFSYFLPQNVMIFICRFLQIADN
jgi:type I restriction enzyme M protein